MSSLPQKIDVHHHVIPPQLAGHTEGLRGMQAPKWTYEADEHFSNDVGIATRIYSVPTPGVSHIADPRENARLAREMNHYSAALRDKDPSKNGFFATVPSLWNKDLAIEEIRYAFDELHADGVTLFTSYSRDHYLGHSDFIPIFEELNKRKAVIFVHPCDNGLDVEPFQEHLPGPAFDWPHETGRTAIDLILHHRLQQFPDVKIILSHGGGTLISLIRRATLISLPEFGAYMSADQMITDAKKFYFDTALSASEEMLPLVLGFAEKGHVLFGSDFPHATAPFSKMFTEFLDSYAMDELKRKDLYCGAADVLFPRLKN